MIPINMQCWLNVGWGLTEFIIRIQGKWGCWVRSRCSLSQELKHTGVWETSHSFQWSQGPHLYVPLRIAAFLQVPHFSPPSPTFSNSTILSKIIYKRMSHWLPSTFFCSNVCEVENKKFNCFSSKWENTKNKWESCNKKSVRSLVCQKWILLNLAWAKITKFFKELLLIILCSWLLIQACIYVVVLNRQKACYL